MLVRIQTLFSFLIRSPYFAFVLGKLCSLCNPLLNLLIILFPSLVLITVVEFITFHNTQAFKLTSCHSSHRPYTTISFTNPVSFLCLVSFNLRFVDVMRTNSLFRIEFDILLFLYHSIVLVLIF